MGRLASAGDARRAQRVAARGGPPRGGSAADGRGRRHRQDHHPRPPCGAAHLAGASRRSASSFSPSPGGRRPRCSAGWTGCSDAPPRTGRRPRGCGAGPSTRSPPACSASHGEAHRPSTRASPSTTAATPRTCSTSCAPSSSWAGAERRFPRKATCLAIYCRCVNAQRPRCDAVLETRFPWCADDGDELQAPVQRLRRPQAAAAASSTTTTCSSTGPRLMQRRRGGAAVARAVRPRAGRRVPGHQRASRRRSCTRLRPDGRGLTVVGDDAQSIYSLPRRHVRNILDFPQHSRRPGVVSSRRTTARTPPLLDATNRVIAQAARAPRQGALVARRRAGERARAGHRAADEAEQTDYVVERDPRAPRGGRRPAAAGGALPRLAPQPRASSSSWRRRNIPFHKYGGLQVRRGRAREGPARPSCASPRTRSDLARRHARAAALCPASGPATARRAARAGARSGTLRRAGAMHAPAAATMDQLPALVRRCRELAAPQPPALSLAAAPDPRLLRAAVRGALRPRPGPRSRPRAARADRGRLRATASAFLAELTLDPPAPRRTSPDRRSLDDDYLVLSTIHSAKGLEWDAVYVIHAADGNIPSDMTTGSPEEIDEERRLFYVALTRARRHLSVTFPLRWFDRPAGVGGRHALAQLTRFLPPPVAAGSSDGRRFLARPGPRFRPRTPSSSPR